MVLEFYYPECLVDAGGSTMMSYTAFCFDWQVSGVVSQYTNRALGRGLSLLEAKKGGDQCSL